MSLCLKCFSSSCRYDKRKKARDTKNAKKKKKKSKTGGRKQRTVAQLEKELQEAVEREAAGEDVQPKKKAKAFKPFRKFNRRGRG